MRIVGLIKENLNVSYYFGGVKGIDCELLAKKKPSSVKKSKNRLAEKHGLSIYRQI